MTYDDAIASLPANAYWTSTDSQYRYVEYWTAPDGRRWAVFNPNSDTQDTWHANAITESRAAAK